MLADLDLLLTAVFVTADDLLPEKPKNARRSVTDAEVVTLSVAQAIMDIPSDREFLAVAVKRIGHLFPRLPGQAGYWKRRQALTETVDWLIGVFAQDSPGFYDDLLLIDSTPVECGRSVDTSRRSQLGPACARETIVADKGYAGRRFETATRELFRRHDPAAPPQDRKRRRATPRPDPPMHREHLLDAQRPPRPRTPQRPHPPRHPRPHRPKLLALTTAIWLNHQLGRPTRALANLAT